VKNDVFFFVNNYKKLNRARIIKYWPHCCSIYALKCMECSKCVRLWARDERLNGIPTLIPSSWMECTAKYV